MTIERCDGSHDFEVDMNALKDSLFDEEVFLNWAYLLKTLGDKNRLKLLYLLTQTDELCVCEISDLLEISQPLTSHMLRLLKQMDILESRKNGTSVYYSIKKEEIKEFLGHFIALDID